MVPPILRCTMRANSRTRTIMKIQKFRKEAGLTQQQLADRMDVSLDLVKKWESKSKSPRSTRKPHINDLKKLAKVLGRTIEELL